MKEQDYKVDELDKNKIYYIDNTSYFTFNDKTVTLYDGRHFIYFHSPSLSPTSLLRQLKFIVSAS